MICASYTKSIPGENADIMVTKKNNEAILSVKTVRAIEFKELMV